MKYLIILLMLSTSAFAEISVGTKVSEPFVFHDESGYYGISISLLDKLMDNIGETYSIEEVDVINGLKNKSIDIGIYNMSITSEREKYIDFTTPYYTTNLAFGYEREKKGVLDTLLDSEFLKFLVILVTSIIAVALLMKVMGEMSFGTGTWFATVTSTTVGYGDEAPKKTLSRIVVVIWMFTSLILVSSFTATLSSSMVINYVEQNIDAKNKLIGVVEGSTGHDYAKVNDYKVKTFSNLKDLITSDVDVFLYDQMSLKYCLSDKYTIESIDNTPQFYGIGITNKELQEKINVELPNILKSKWWQLELRKYK